MSSALQNYPRYEMVAIDHQNRAILSHSQITAKIQQSPPLISLFDLMRQQLERVKPSSFRVSWIALPPLDATQSFAAIQFRFAPYCPLDFHVTFQGNQIHVFRPTRRGLSPVRSPFSKETGEAIKGFVTSFQLHTLLQGTANPAEGCCTPIFCTSVFPDYLRQLQNQLSQCEASFEKNQLMAILSLFSLCSINHRPKIHEIFVQQLRRSEKLSKAISRWFYTQCDLSAAWWQLLLDLTQSQMPEPGDFLKAVAWYVNALNRHPSLIEVQKILPVDMLSAGNLPSFLWDMKHPDGSVTRIIRSCSVLYYVGQNTQPLPCDILPEFEKMLRDLKGMYFYFDLRAMPEEISSRIVLKTALQNHPNIKIYHVDRDSERYDQINAHSQEQNAQLASPDYFKKDQLRHLQQDPGEANCFWTDVKEKELWIKHYASLQERIHTYYFNSSATLEDEERNDLNELTLLYMAFHKLCTDKPAVASFSCLMSADRGPSFYTLLYLLNCLTAGIPIGPDQIKMALSMLLAPAILTENRLMQEIRLDVFFRVARRLLSRPPLTL